MRKRLVLTGSASVLLLLALLGAQFATPVRAAATIYVDAGNVGDPLEDGSQEHPFDEIQEGLNAAHNGDTVRVASGTYYENVVVNKRVNLVGEDCENTIIDGDGKYHVVRVAVDGVRISGFTMRDGMEKTGAWYGLHLHQCDEAVISGNIFLNNSIGIEVEGSNDNVIQGNVIRYNQHGIDLTSSSGNTIQGNTLTENRLCSIDLFSSDENTITENIIEPRSGFASISIRLTSHSDRNIVCRNNFLGDPNRVVLQGSIDNTWDNGAEGNHWSDYEGEDLDGDGVGDTLLPHLGVDYRPLMEPWSMMRIFNITWDGITYRVAVLCSSTIASFNFDPALEQISFTITGLPGLCNVTIPIGLFEKWSNSRSGVLMIQVDGVPVDYTWTQNATHFSMCFNHSQGRVAIFEAFGALKGSWYKGVGTPEYDSRVDLNKDGFVGGFDFSTLARYWWKWY